MLHNIETNKNQPKENLGFENSNPENKLYELIGSHNESNLLRTDNLSSGSLASIDSFKTSSIPSNANLLPTNVLSSGTPKITYGPNSFGFNIYTPNLNNTEYRNHLLETANYLLNSNNHFGDADWLAKKAGEKLRLLATFDINQSTNTNWGDNSVIKMIDAFERIDRSIQDILLGGVTMNGYLYKVAPNQYQGNLLTISTGYESMRNTYKSGGGLPKNLIIWH